jgi:hypothetical protein
MITKNSLTKILLSVSIFIALFNFIGCKIDGGKVKVDDKTYVYAYKDNGKKVSGTVIFYEIDKESGKRYKARKRTVKDGLRIGDGYTYFPDGNIGDKQPYVNGLESGTEKYWHSDGSMEGTCEWKDGKKNGIEKEYGEKGIQTKETVYENDVVVNEYEYDESGNKIIPPIEKLELVATKTGFYEYRDYSHGELLYQPLVMIKFKNIDKVPFTEKIAFSSTFTSNGEEWANDSAYFNGYGDTPLQPGIVRQITLLCSVGYRSPTGVKNANVECVIYADKKKYKTIKLEKEFLDSNRF